jgi:Na+-transporting methylmalonyl-CoA/oxaloacetate decarboxylase gamma subunit
MNAAPSLMNRASNRISTFMSSTTNLLMVGLGLVLIVFVFLVLYNRTVGDKVRSGWEQIKTILRNKGIIEVEVGPGDAAIKATLTPEPSVILPPLTATLLPEPVTVSKPADEPPNDGVHVPTKDRPAGMPGATQSSSSLSSLSSISSSLFDHDKDSKRTKGSILSGSEVFNVSKNIYTFNDAAAVCAAAGGELATYDQVKEAYEKGADWCNYGWVKGQMAVYPTQKSTWEKLQKGSPEFRNACGQPGVNGGYVDNPELRFGVNCYGTKPGKKASDEILDSQVALPQSPAELEFEKQVQRFRDQMDVATILPFQKGQWNE